ncbi:MAG: branched-chain amino acid ABC transporter permease, partial [Anaerolineae bacterium]
GGERPRNQVSRPASAGVWAGPLVLLGLALLITWQQAPLSQAIIGLDSNWRFALALVIGTLSGGLLGALIEWSLIRPLYARPIFQVLMTLGLAFVLNEVVRALWGPAGFSMARPELFDQNCRAATLLDWAVNHCSRIDMLGRPFPTYRLFIIVVGLAIALIVALVLQRSRLGMIIRAGVQDAEMVQALGINVRQVFTLVFAAGAALAALGGVIAAPFLGVYTDMGLEFQLQGFIAVVIGGMGSYPGTALGAVVLGLARAIGDNVAGATIARASAVLIMTLILLVKPSGLLGKKE